jgi:hypothetical protein
MVGVAMVAAAASAGWAEEPAAPADEKMVADLKVAEAKPADTSGGAVAPATPAPATPAPGAPEPAATAAPAAPEAVVEPAGGGPNPIEITGFVDTYYGVNFNDPDGDTQLRNFDTKHGQLSLNVIEVALEQKPSAQNRLGFRADLNFGPVTDMVHAFEPGGADVFKAFEQAYLSVLAPVGQGLQVDVGKFVTPHGAEVIEAKDNWNYSRSLLFALAIPYYHVGLRAALPVGDKVTFTGFAVNGWNNGVDNNGAKTFGLQGLLKPGSRLSIVQTVMTGAEQADDDDSRRFLSDTTVTFNVTPSFALMANYDYGRDTVAGSRVTWQGVAGYLRYQVTPSFALSPRFEWLRDKDGFMTGTVQDLRELTLTSELKVAGALLTRIEYRRDMSNQSFFATDTGTSKSQNTFTIGLMYAFGAKL